LCAQTLAGVLYGSDSQRAYYVTIGKITAIKHQQLMLYVTHTRLLYLMLKHLLAQKVLYVNVTQISLYLAQMAYAISAHVKNSKTSVVKSTRNELIKLPVFSIKCKAMMGICIYWISRHVIFGKRCKYSSTI
jgi:hypothetical protein